MNFGPSSEFVAKIMKDITPFQHLSGTEHVAPLLYSMIRMLKPETVVEFGTGFTTPFILQALKDNADDYKHHQTILKKKAIKHHDKLSDPERNKVEDIEDWWQDEVTQDVYGREPILPIPSFYLKAYNPQLFSFEVLPAEDIYVDKLKNVVNDLNLNHLFTLNAGVRVKNYTDLIPPSRLPIDFAWNDFGNKHKFYKETYESINANGGIMAFHNTTNSEKDFKEDLDRVKEEIQPLLESKQCELLTFLEPHKFTQRSMTLLRKLSDFKEEYFEDSRDGFDQDMLKLPRAVGRRSFP